MTGKQDYETLLELIESLQQTTDEIEGWGTENEFPAVERTAVRLQGTIDTLEQNVPPELAEWED